jgi:CubicO group peptidase (beta-lactamase class C family)
VNGVAELVLAATAIVAERQGIARLDDHLVDRVPELEGDLGPHAREVTLEQLLVESAGIPGGAVEPHCTDDDRPSLDQLVQLGGFGPLWFPPGTILMQSPRSTVLAALMLERASGTSYRELVRRLVLEPAGTAITFERREAAKRGFRDGVDDTLGMTCPPTDVIGLYASIRDVMAVLRFVMNDPHGDLGSARGRLFDAGAAAPAFLPCTHAALWFVPFTPQLGGGSEGVHGGELGGYSTGIDLLPDGAYAAAVLGSSENGFGYLAATGIAYTHVPGPATCGPVRPIGERLPEYLGSYHQPAETGASGTMEITYAPPIVTMTVNGVDRELTFDPDANDFAELHLPEGLLPVRFWRDGDGHVWAVSDLFGQLGPPYVRDATPPPP